MLLAEEGLATLNTHLRLACKLLWKPALHYCKYTYIIYNRLLH